MNNKDKADEFRELLTAWILKSHGPLLHGDLVWQMLGYSSSVAMRSALCRDTLPVTIFELPHRHGKFGLSEEFAQWLYLQRIKHCKAPPFDGADIQEQFSDIPVERYLQRYNLLLHEEEIMALLKLSSRDELLEGVKKNDFPFPIFRLDNRRSRLFALLPEVVKYIES